MKKPFSLSVALLTVFLAMTACDAPPKETTMNSDIDKLSRLIELPVQPRKARWEVIETGTTGGMGPNDWTLVAILEFTPENYRSVIDRLRIGPLKQALQLPFLPWYPDEIKKWPHAANSGRYLFEGEAASAEPFFSPPLLQGEAIPIPSADALLLVLTTS